MTLGTWNGAAQMYSRGAAAVEATGAAADPSIRAAVEAVQWCAVLFSAVQWCAVVCRGLQWCAVEVGDPSIRVAELRCHQLQPAPGLLPQCTRGAQEGL